jgi:hypothetical protein
MKLIIRICKDIGIFSNKNLYFQYFNDDALYKKMLTFVVLEKPGTYVQHPFLIF